MMEEIDTQTNKLKQSIGSANVEVSIWASGYHPPERRLILGEEVMFKWCLGDRKTGGKSSLHGMCNVLAERGSLKNIKHAWAQSNCWRRTF